MAFPCLFPYGKGDYHINRPITCPTLHDWAEHLLSLAHLYGLPKTHKKKLAMRPMLSATGMYNFKLAKWLDEKLKPLSVNDHTVSDIF
jgi:hypothetical protein